MALCKSKGWCKYCRTSPARWMELPVSYSNGKDSG